MKKITPLTHLFRVVLSVLALLLIPTVTNAQDVDVSKCGDSVDNTKRCIASFVDALEKIKQKHQDQVTLLKMAKMETPKLKGDYNTARDQIKGVGTLLTRNSPDFNAIRIQFNTAIAAAKTFYDGAQVALNKPAGGGLSSLKIFDWFFDNSCRLLPLPNAASVDICNEVVKYLQSLNLKNRIQWKSWDKVPKTL
jgi:hypothetical protein